MSTSKLLDILENAFQPPDGFSWSAGDDVDHYYRKWGFTIYRTWYGPGSHEQWSALLAKMNEQALEEIDTLDEDADNSVAEKAESLFRLDSRSDATLLSDKRVDQVRAAYREQATSDDEATRPLLHDSTGPQRVFLLADRDVLEGVDRDAYFWIKCVQVDHEETHPQQEEVTRAGNQGSGWFRMTTRSVVDLCWEIHYDDLESIAPGLTNVEGDSVVYNGELTGLRLDDKMCSGK